MRIGSWDGRLGNNLIQVLKGLTVALHHKDASLSVPPHWYLKDMDVGPGGESGIVANSFFDMMYPEFFPEAVTIARSSLPIPERGSHLVMHIRGGDIFRTDRVNIRYAQPPVGFYLEVAALLNWTQIIIMAEDNANPVLGRLMQLLPEATFRVGKPLNEDWRILTSASHIAMSCSSLSMAAAVLSQATIFTCPSDYFEKMGPWRYSVVQLGMMLDEKKTGYVEGIADHQTIFLHEGSEEVSMENLHSLQLAKISRKRILRAQRMLLHQSLSLSTLR